jgi:cation diffusion facilitator CzcD-associated flavoprotein CzcO
MDKFKGIVHHSSFWPDTEIPVENKRCAIIGTGASGVQITQAWGPRAGSLTVFQRTPNLGLPMHKQSLTPESQNALKHYYPELFRYRETTFAGFLYDWAEKNTFDDTPADREAFYEKVWQEGGFRFWVSIYKDNVFDAEANKESYAFWAKKTRARIQDPRLRDLLAPDPKDMPHFFGIKRPALERDYYEQFNRENVDLVDIRSNGIREFTETGIRLENGEHYEFDVVAVATGFVSSP